MGWLSLHTHCTKQKIGLSTRLTKSTSNLTRNCTNTKSGTKRRNFKVGSTSTSATRRKLDVYVLESSSQPLIENAPLFDSQQRIHHTRSISNSSIIHNIYMFAI
ncbi:hypothetical protein ACOSQ2_014052 [Xanthoceras sorbifolium]